MKINKILAVAAMSLGFLSCSSEGELAPAVDTLKDTPLQITASVAGMQTRAGYDANSVPDQFYLKIRQGLDESHKQKYWYDVIMKLENGEWVAYDLEGNNKIQLLRAGYDIYCYLDPSTFYYELDDYGNMKNKCVLKVFADQSSDVNVKASDHLYGSNTDNNKEVKAIELQLEHQMSKLSLELTLGSEYEEEQNPITDMQIVGTKGEVYWSSGYLNDKEDASAVAITPFCVSYAKPTADSKNAKVCYEVILAPQTVEAGTFGVEFKILGKAYRWSSDAAVTLAKGTQYTLQLKAGKDQVSPVEVTSKAWNVDDANNKDIETF